MKTRGFVTIATGDEMYFILARNLLRSYRHFAQSPMPFAIITDKCNKYTAEFDQVIILDKVYNSYMDKLSLLKTCPFDENIFIDADCLAYTDINFYWDAFEGASDFSCLGSVNPLDYQNGWFKKGEVAEFNDKIHYIPNLHSGICFIRKSEILDELYNLSLTIINNYNRYTFIAFNDKPADEPVFALAMAVLNLRPVQREEKKFIFFLPGFLAKLRFPFFMYFPLAKNPIHFETAANNKNKKKFPLIHFGNIYTHTPQYKADTYILARTYKKGTVSRGYKLFIKFFSMVHLFPFAIIVIKIKLKKRRTAKHRKKPNAL